MPRVSSTTKKRIGGDQEEPGQVFQRTPIKGVVFEELGEVYLAQTVPDHGKSVEL